MPPPTPTYREITVSPRTFDELDRKMREAGLHQEHWEGGKRVLDMYGVGLVRGTPPLSVLVNNLPR